MKSKNLSSKNPDYDIKITELNLHRQPGMTAISQLVVSSDDYAAEDGPDVTEFFVSMARRFDVRLRAGVLIGTIEKAKKQGYRLLLPHQYGGQQAVIKGQVLSRNPKEALSRTAWRRKGYRVLPDAEPHSVRFHPLWLREYSVYRRDQVQAMQVDGQSVDRRTAIAWIELDESDDKCTRSEPRPLTPDVVRSARLAEFTGMLEGASRGYGRPRGYIIMGLRLARWAPEFVDDQAWNSLRSLVLVNLEAMKHEVQIVDLQIYAWVEMHLADFLQLIPPARRKHTFLEGVRMEMFSYTCSAEWKKAHPNGFTDEEI